MRILGISAHYHDSAAALLVDGVPVCAVQEERLSRHKNDATFPAGAIEWCLDHAGLDPADLDAVVFYERSMLKFERILTCALRAFPRSLAVVSARDEELARREGLGSRHHLVAPRRAGAQDPVHAAPRIARGCRLPHGADAARGDPHRRRRRANGPRSRSVTASGAPTAAPTSRCCAKSDSRIRSGCCTRRSRRISASRSTRTSTRSWGSPPTGVRR